MLGLWHDDNIFSLVSTMKARTGYCDNNVKILNGFVVKLFLFFQSNRQLFQAGKASVNSQMRESPRCHGHLSESRRSQILWCGSVGCVGALHWGTEGQTVALISFLFFLRNYFTVLVTFG